MNPLFFVVVSAGLLAVRLLVGRRIESDAVTTAHRQALESSVSGVSALIVPLVGTVLSIVGAFFAMQSDRNAWLWLVAAALFLGNLLLVLQTRHRLTGSWFKGGKAPTGKRARANRLGVSAAICFVGYYVLAWSMGPDPQVWVQVAAFVLLIAFIGLMTAVGFLMIFALQDEANSEWEERRRR